MKKLLTHSPLVDTNITWWWIVYVVDYIAFSRWVVGYLMPSCCCGCWLLYTLRTVVYPGALSRRCCCGGLSLFLLDYWVIKAACRWKQLNVFILLIWEYRPVDIRTRDSTGPSTFVHVTLPARRHSYTWHYRPVDIRTRDSTGPSTFVHVTAPARRHSYTWQHRPVDIRTCDSQHSRMSVKVVCWMCVLVEEFCVWAIIAADIWASVKTWRESEGEMLQ